MLHLFNSIPSFFQEPHYQQPENVRGDCLTYPDALPEWNSALRPKMIFQLKITLTSPRRMILDLHHLQKKNLKLASSIDLSLETLRTLDKKKRTKMLHMMIRKFKHFSHMRISYAEHKYGANGDFMIPLARDLRYFLHLSTLSLNFIDHDPWYDALANRYNNALADKCIQDLSALSMGLTHLYGLIDLTLQFKLYRITSEQFQKLSSCVRYLPSLVSLSHNLDGCNNLSERAITILNSDLKRASSLLSLSLNFCGLKCMTFKAIANLDFKRLTSLLALNINLRIFRSLTRHNNNHYADKYLEAFAIGLLSLRSLSSLKLCFLESCNEKEIRPFNTGIESLCLSMKNLKLLTKLSLDFSYLRTNSVTAKLTDLPIQNIAQISLINLSLLTTLTLNLENMITKASIKSLSEAVQALTSLESLTLYFSSAPINDMDMKFFSNALKSLAFLKNLTLDFQYCKQISNKAFGDLSEAICHLNSLEKLDLTFRKCGGVSSEGLKSLSGGLKFLNNLKSLLLTLYTGPNNEIQSTGIAALSEGLKGKQSLKELSISLRHSNRIDFDVVALSEALKYLSKVESFSIDIYKSTEVTEKSFDALCTSLKHLKMLSSLSLKFQYCPHLVGKPLGSLCELLACLPFLSHLRIAFGAPGQMPEFMEEDVRSVLNTISCLNSLKELEMRIITTNYQIVKMMVEFRKTSLIHTINFSFR